MKTQIVLIDGKNFVYRFAHTHRELRTVDGQSTSVLYGCPTGLLSLAKRFPGAPLVWVWDGEGPTWRHELLKGANTGSQKKSEPTAKVTSLPPYLQMSVDYITKATSVRERESTSVNERGRTCESTKVNERGKTEERTIASERVDATESTRSPERPVGYKANRPARDDEYSMEIQEQLRLFKIFLRRMGQRQFEVKNLEGDDMMGILVTHLTKKELFDEVIIHSNDRDFYQFISERVKVLRSVKEGGYAKPEDIEQEFGITCDQYTRLRALIGDSADNIPHLFHRVGPKTAVAWLRAGVDPSYKSWDQHSPQTQSWIESHAKHDVGGSWEAVHRNYICCQIVRSTTDSHLHSSVRNGLAFISELQKKDFEADQERRTEDNYRWLIKFLAKYEMASLYGDREALWNLP